MLFADNSTTLLGGTSLSLVMRCAALLRARVAVEQEAAADEAEAKATMDEMEMAEARVAAEGETLHNAAAAEEAAEGERTPMVVVGCCSTVAEQ